jgi:hypothetical protein
MTSAAAPEAADHRGLRVVYGRPGPQELAALVAVLLLRRPDPEGAGPAPTAPAADPGEPAWLRGPYVPPASWTAGR